MARRYNEIKALAEFTARMIVSSEEDWKKFLHTAGHMYIVGSDHTCVGTAKDDYQSADQSRMLGSRSRFPTPGNLCHFGIDQ